MKQIEEQTYYEILEVSPDASLKEIQRAYDHAKETFHADSLATYSLFSEEEMRNIQAAIEEAYRVLMDEALRRSYDQSHLRPIERAPMEKFKEMPVKPSEIKDSLSFTDLSMEVGDMTYRGRSLKEVREKLGIDLKTISTETKINMKTLELIENEDMERLPAPVYLKGFLKAYARALNLDSQKVIEGYFQLFRDEKKK
jgi:flagellar biosynthesis protein FlhG